jgi:hypothetical protein
MIARLVRALRRHFRTVELDRPLHCPSCHYTVRRVSHAMHQLLGQGVALRCMWCGRRMNRPFPQETSK